MRTLYVGGIPQGTDVERLRLLFSSYGGVESARIVRREETGTSRGFGYVTFLSELAAFKAREALDGQRFEGATLRVDVAR